MCVVAFLFVSKGKIMTRGTVRGRISKDKPNPVDVHVGNRMRIRRTILGYSQQYIAHRLGITFQQIQKYEKGENRVGASRLWDISKVLKVKMDYFFEDMPKETLKSSPMMLIAPEENNLDIEAENDPMKKADTVHLVKAYYEIANRKVRRNMLRLIIRMSTSNNSMPFDKDD